MVTRQLDYNNFLLLSFLFEFYSLWDNHVILDVDSSNFLTELDFSNIFTFPSVLFELNL